MAEKKGVIAGFKEFVLQGNVVDLAIAVVIGTAFAAVIKAFVADILTPLIAAIFGAKTGFSALFFKLNGQPLLYGDVIDAIITFLATAAVLYFLVVVPLNKVNERKNRGIADPESPLRPCPECLTDIPKAATRCLACTAQVPAVV